MRPECQHQLPDGGCRWRFAVDCGVEIGHMALRLPDAVALAKEMDRKCRSAAGGAVCRREYGSDR
jgi:hypothetical protein